MRRLALAAGVFAVGSVALAQQIPSKPLLPRDDRATTRQLPSEILGTAKGTPAKPSADSPPAPPPPPQKFDSTALSLKGERGQWQLWAGGLLLKDFGPSQANADEALRLFRELRIDSHGSVGGVFDYWLSNGEPPAGTTRQRQVINFDAPSLRVEQVNGNWILRDAKMSLYNFGRSQADANEALVVCKQYGFNQIGVVGGQTPALKYLLKDTARRLPDASPPATLPAAAQLLAGPPLLPPLTLPGYGAVGEREAIEYRRLEVKRDGGEFVLTAATKPLGRFGTSEREAKAAANVLAEFRCSEVCKIGDARFFLSNGRAPQGSSIGLPARAFRPENLAVRAVNGVWGVADGTRTLVEVGTRQDADRMLAAIREYRFDAICAVGGGKLGNVNLFVRNR